MVQWHNILSGRTLIYLTCTLAAVAGLVFYGIMDPESSALYPQCIFRSLTGLKCPGCGSQRAVHDLLNGNLGGAFSHNAAMVCAIPFLTVLLLSGIMRDRLPRLNSFMEDRRTITAVAVIIILWWITRNIADI